MEDFKKFAAGLSKRLSANEENLLFCRLNEFKNEYAKTGDNNTYLEYLTVREKLISHNLRLCADFAIECYQKSNGSRDIEDIYGDAIIEMMRVIDNYDVNRGTPFHMLAYKYMYFNYEKENRVRNYDALSHIESRPSGTRVDRVYAGEFDAYSTDGLVSDFAGSDDFVVDISNFIDTLPNERNRLLLKMKFGLGYNKTYSCIELGTIFGISKQAAASIVRQFRRQIKKYMGDKYPLSFSTFSNDSEEGNDKCVEGKYITHNYFDSILERDDYIYGSYYGLDGYEHKSTIDLMEELFVSEATIRRVVHSRNAFRNEEDIERLVASGMYDSQDDLLISIFSDYYGINGREMLDKQDIIKKYCFQGGAFSTNIIFRGKFLLGIKSDEFAVLEEKRKQYENNKMLAKYKTCYEMFYGLNGYEKMGYSQIAQKLGIAQSQVYLHKNRYKNYLDSSQSGSSELSVDEICDDSCVK